MSQSIKVKTASGNMNTRYFISRRRRAINARKPSSKELRYSKLWIQRGHKIEAIAEFYRTTSNTLERMLKPLEVIYIDQEQLSIHFEGRQIEFNF